MKRILFLESKDGVFDALRNCSDSADISAFCVTGICKNLCIISKCKEGMQNNERNSQKPMGMQYYPSKYFGMLLK